MAFKVQIVFLMGLFSTCFCFSGEMLQYSDSTTCDDNEYFDSHLLKCIVCDKNKFLEPTENKLSCTCNSHSKIVEMGIGQFPRCKMCNNNELPTHDRRECIPCYSQSTNGTSMCMPCSPQQITVDREYSGKLTRIIQCVNCTGGTKPSSNGKFCEPCVFNCSCPADTHEEIEQICVPVNSLQGWPDDKNSYIINFENGEKIDSYFIRKYLRLSIYLCKMNNRTACQVLANICTLVMLSDDYVGSPCKVFQDSKHIPTSDSNRLPWLYYGEGDAQTVLNRKKITVKYSMDFKSKASLLNFTVVRFTPEGLLKGISPASGSFLQLCPESWTNQDLSLRFGTQYRHSCTIPAHQLVQLRETEFLDLYLHYVDGGESIMYAIPTLILNMNKVSDRTQWQLTRRFFMLDKIGGIKSAADKISSRRKIPEIPSVIRYVKSCTLRVRVQDESDEGLIYPPLLVLKYGEITQEDIDNGVQVTLSFNVEYEMASSMSHAIEVSVGVLSALAVVWSGIQTWSWSRRSGRVGIDLMTLAQLVLFVCGNLSNVFFFVVGCASFHNFTFYKGQSVVQVLLPSRREEKLIRDYIISAFSLKIVEVIHLIGRQISVDIFFIDWERPRARSSITRPQSQVVITTSDGTEQPISIWRTYFVANEWNEIQTKRKISLPFQLILSVFVLKVLGVENWAFPDPDLHTVPPDYMKCSSPNLVCRFAVGLIVYLFIYFIQWIFTVAIYERYIKNVVQEFVDICSMANISVFILALEKYGFYIHGRSAHGFADTDMQTMLGQLQREEEDLCGHRGLLPGSDQQTFHMAIPLQLRAYYRKVMAPIGSVIHSTKRLSMAGTGGLRSKVLTGNMERSIHAYHNMNKFLAAFLEHALKDLDYEVREKTFVESLLDIEFTEVFDKGVLYSDSGHSFDNILFYGNEWTLATFDIIIFSFVEILFHDFLLAAVFTAFCAEILKTVRRAGGRMNLAKKTLIDERFLV